MEKDGEARQATGDDTVWHMYFVCWMTMGSDTLGISNNYCFFTATVVTCSCFSVNLYVLYTVHLIFKCNFLLNCCR